jgi:hypothetical protein
MFGLTSLAGIGHGAAAAWRWPLARLGRLAPRPAQAPAPRTLRPVVMPETLEDLRGPASGPVELPVRLYWSAGSRTFDLDSRHEAADMYEAVLDVASSRGDLARYLNAGLLVQVWPVLGMNRAKRAAWENRFPVLRRQRLAAAA